jgi:hypothetical protein
MHVNVEVDTGMEDKDLDQGENIFVKKKEGGVVNKNWLILLSTHQYYKRLECRRRRCQRVP